MNIKESLLEKVIRILPIVVLTVTFSGCHPEQDPNAPSPEESAASSTPSVAFPKFSEEIRSLSDEELTKLGDPNGIPSEYIFPGSYFAEVVYPDSLKEFDKDSAFLSYIESNVTQLPISEAVQDAQILLLSRGYTFEELKESQKKTVVHDNFPTPVEVIYIKTHSPVDVDKIKQNVFNGIESNQLVSRQFGGNDVTLYENNLIVPLGQQGQKLGIIDCMRAALCFPSEDSVLFISGSSSAIQSFFSAAPGDSRGIAAQRLSHIPTNNVSLAIQYDYDCSFPNTQLVQLPVPVTPELMEVIQKDALAFQFIIKLDPSSKELLTLNINAKSEEGANNLRKSVSSSLLQILEQLNTTKDKATTKEAKETITGLISLLKSANLATSLNNVEGTLPNTKENREFVLSNIKKMNDAQSLALERAQYQIPEQKLLVLASVFTRYSRENKVLPSPICNEAGEPLLSWRVAILPTLGGQYKTLYDKFNLNEPWNSEHNLQLLDQIPDIFVTENDPASKNMTRFLLFNAPETPFGRSPQGLKLQEVDDPYSTLSVVYADESHAIEWTKPEEFVFNPNKPTESFGKHVSAVTIMGELISIPCDDTEQTSKTLAALVYGNGGEEEEDSPSKSPDTSAESTDSSVD